MITAIFGPPGSGKSLYAEAEAHNSTGRILYVGTLPQSTFFQDKLRLHRSRRPTTWSLFELTQSWMEQRVNLERALDESDVALIEGLTYYAYRQQALDRFSDYEESDLLEFVQHMHGHRGKLFVIDAPIPTTLPFECRRRLSTIQNSVIDCAENVVWVQEGRAAAVSVQNIRVLLSGYSKELVS